MIKKLNLDDFVNPGETFHIGSGRKKKSDPKFIHTHQFYEIFWVQWGKGIHHVNGHSYELSPKDLVLMRPQDKHFFSTQSEQGFDMVNIAFYSSSVTHLQRRYFKNENDFWGGNSSLPAKFILTSTQLDWLESSRLELFNGPKTLFKIEHFLLGLFNQLDSYVHPSSELTPNWIRKLIEQINSSEGLHETPKSLAAQGGVSLEHLSRAFKKWFGKKPTEFLIERRIKHAADQLLTSNQDILKICYDSGFNNLSHFYRLFKQHFGITPHQYRRSKYNPF